MDSFFGGVVLFGLIVVMLGCITFTYDMGKGYAPFSIENMRSTGYLSVGCWTLGSAITVSFGCIIAYEAWENGINRRVDEKLERCQQTMRSEIQDQYERTLRKKKED